MRYCSDLGGLVEFNYNNYQSKRSKGEILKLNTDDSKVLGLSIPLVGTWSPREAVEPFVIIMGVTSNSKTQRELIEEFVNETLQKNAKRFCRGQGPP